MSRRRTRTQKEWKVEMTGLAIESPPTSLSTRSTISAAALLVKVIARMDSGITPRCLDEMGDAIGDDARLAAAGAGQNEHRAVGGFDGLTLLRVELERKDKVGMLILLGMAASCLRVPPPDCGVPVRLVFVSAPFNGDLLAERKMFP